jgi:hypothetical protein
VFLACVPLVGLEAVGAALGDAYPNQLEHVMVLVRRFDRAESGEETSTVECYDFLPVDPLAPATAAAMLSGGEVAGDLRVRALRGVPSRRCWKVGTYVPSDVRTTRAIGESESTSTRNVLVPTRTPRRARFTAGTLRACAFARTGKTRAWSTRRRSRSTSPETPCATMS